MLRGEARERRSRRGLRGSVRFVGAERRKHPRVSITVAVSITSGHNFYVGRTRDISESGLFIETPIGIDIGSRVDVKLELGRKQFSLESEVIWALADEAGKTTGVGVRFVQLTQAARDAIDAFMTKRDPDGIDLEPEVEVPPLPGAAPKGPPPLPE